MAAFSPAVYLRHLYATHAAIAGGDRPNANTVAARLGISRRTVQRYVYFLRDQLGAPVAFDPSANGWHYTSRFDFGRALLAWLQA